MQEKIELLCYACLRDELTMQNEYAFKMKAIGIWRRLYPRYVMDENTLLRNIRIFAPDWLQLLLEGKGPEEMPEEMRVRGGVECLCKHYLASGVTDPAELTRRLRNDMSRVRAAGLDALIAATVEKQLGNPGYGRYRSIGIHVTAKQFQRVFGGRPRRRSGRSAAFDPAAEAARAELIQRRVQAQIMMDSLMIYQANAGSTVEKPEPDDDDDSSGFVSSMGDYFVECMKAADICGNEADETLDQLYGALLEEDRTLLYEGSLTYTGDMSMSIVALRSILLGIANLKGEYHRREVLRSAFELIQRFGFPYSDRLIMNRLDSYLRFYIAGGVVPAPVLALLRDSANLETIRIAYELYLSQYRQGGSLIEARMNEQRRRDETFYMEAEKRRTEAMFRQLTDTDFGGPLGVLKLIDADPSLYTEEELRHFVHALLAKLSDVGLESFGTEHLGQPFVISGEDRARYADVSRQLITDGARYKLVQPGWCYDGEIIVRGKVIRA